MATEQRSSGGATALVLIAPLVVVAAVIAFAVQVGSSDGASAPTPSPTVAEPTPTTTSADGVSVFAVRDDGTPVRWDPCTPIRWAHDLRGAPDGAEALVEAAFKQLSFATRLPFAPTDHAPSDVLGRDRSTVGADGRWAPILIGWTSDDLTDLPLELTDRAVAIPVAVDAEGGQVIVTAQVAFNTSWPLDMELGERHTSWGIVILHELGHVLGLDHVTGDGALMAPSPGFGDPELTEGDLADLAAVGRRDGSCLDVPAPREVGPLTNVQ